MATQGPSSGSAAATIEDTGYSWTNPINALTANGTTANNTLPNGESSDWLQVTGFGFSVSGTILGILVEVKISATGVAAYNTVAVQLTTGGADEGLADSDSNNIPTTPTYVGVGGAASLWGGAWTPAKINASTFGAKIKVFSDAGSPDTVSIDHVRITITYTPAAAGPTTVARIMMGEG